MASKDLLDFEKAMEYMNPMEVSDYLQKTLDFLKRNNSEVYFPSISPYIESFLVNLVSDTRNLKSKCFNYGNRLLAAEIIEVLEMSKEVFRWTHAYENGNLLVYKKIFSNKIKRKPINLSTIADHMIQARASNLRQPHTHTSNPLHPNPQDPKCFTTSFKLGFLNQTLRFVKSSETKLLYKEMPLSQAEYIHNLLKYRDKDVGLGFKSLYAQLWDAMEEFGVDCDFDVTLKETKSKEMAVLVLEKVPKNSNKSKKDKGSPKKHRDEKHKVEEVMKRPRKENKDPNKQPDQSLNNSFLDPYYVDAAAALPSLGLLTNITDKFFKKSVVALTEFVENENQKIKTFNQLSDDELEFLKEVQSVAESTTLRDTFMPKYRILLWKLDRMVKEARKSFDLATTVDEIDRSITWKKTPKSSSSVKKLSSEPSNLPPLELLANISERFFKHTIAALTDFADDESCASRTLTKLTKEQIVFVKRIREMAGSPKVRELFDPNYRDLLWRLNYSISEASTTCKITTTVNDAEGSITLNKKPKFAKPAPLQPAVKESIFSGVTGSRSKSMVAMKTRDRSISKDRLIQFEKSGNQPATDKDLTTEPQRQARDRSMSKREAKLLEDLSTPVESDIGMRMMLLMGWDGGALGARGDGIMEPVMPKIELPKRGGLGHVPPPKVAPQNSTVVSKSSPKPIDFRLLLLHNLLDFLLHDEKHKQVQFKDPIVHKKKKKFVKHLFQTVNERRHMQLTENENELLVKIYSRLSDYPTMEIKADISKDLKTLTLQKVLDRPLRALNIKIPKPKPTVQPAPKKVDIQPQPAPNKVDVIQPQPNKKNVDIQPHPAPNKVDMLQPQPAPKNVDIQPHPAPNKVDVIQPQPASIKFDVIISTADVNQILPHVVISQMEVPATQQAIRKRALRLLFLRKFADAWSWDRWEQIVFKYQEGGIPTPIVTFLRTVIVHLNKDSWCHNLYGQEGPVYEYLLRLARGYLLTLKFELPSKIILTRMPIIIEDSLPNNFAALKVSDNKTAKTDDRSQTVNVNYNTKDVDSRGKDTSKEINTTNFVDSLKLNEVLNDIKEATSAKNNISMKKNIIFDNADKENGQDNKNIFIQAIEKCSSEEETMVDIDMDVNNNNDDYLTHKSNENDVEEIVFLGANNVENETIDEPKNNPTIQNVTLKDMNDNIKEIDIRNMAEFIENRAEELKNAIEHADHKNNDIFKSSVEAKKEETDFKPDVCDIAGQSDLAEDIQNLEMAILNAEADIECHVKTDSNSEVCALDLEREISDIDLIFDIKQENDDSNICGKRSHSHSICSQELDHKKTKHNTESDDNFVIIRPKNPDQKITQEIVREVQTVIANELDKSGAFLPLLKCNGTQNRGLVYSCHDEDDVTWLKKLISDANLDLEIVDKKDLCLENKSRELLIKINSYIPLDTKKTFRKFEIYNVGLDTKFWKVSFKNTTDSFVMFIVTVDEKSFKYISDEKFSLYCGIDKAQFSIIFK